MKQDTPRNRTQQFWCMHTWGIEIDVKGARQN